MIESNIYLEMILHTNLDLTNLTTQNDKFRCQFAGNPRKISRILHFLLPLKQTNIKKQGDVIPLPD